MRVSSAPGPTTPPAQSRESEPRSARLRSPARTNTPELFRHPDLSDLHGHELVSLLTIAAPVTRDRCVGAAPCGARAFAMRRQGDHREQGDTAITRLFHGTSLRCTPGRRADRRLSRWATGREPPASSRERRGAAAPELLAGRADYTRETKRCKCPCQSEADAATGSQSRQHTRFWHSGRHRRVVRCGGASDRVRMRSNRSVHLGMKSAVLWLTGQIPLKRSEIGPRSRCPG